MQNFLSIPVCSMLVREVITNTRKIYQFDATQTDSAQFAQSGIEIGDQTSNIGYNPTFQRGPDNKIYITHQSTNSLDVINYPNIQGTGCNYVENILSMGGNFMYNGLPQFLERYYVYIHDSGECAGQPVTFHSVIWPQADSIQWDFGDPVSGPSNYSTLPDPFHTFSASGTYTVELYVRHIDNRTDTTWQQFTIDPTYKPVLGPDRSVCLGDSVTFDAGACSACTFQWKDLGTMTIVGTGQTFKTGLAGSYEAAVTNTYGCTGRDTVQLMTNPQPNVTNNPLSKTICSGESTNISLTSDVPGTVFHWTASLTSGNITGFSGDSGLVISQVLVNSLPTPGVVTYHITPKIGSCVGNTVDFPVTVNQEDSVKISIVASANNVCQGTPVTFTATPTNGGTSPSYQWKVNGIGVGTNNPVYTYAPANGDVVTCVLTSSITECISNNPASSNQVIMVIMDIMDVSISISASANPVCSGTAVMFTATPVNQGTSPVYQWKVNGVNVGTNSNMYTYNPASGDQVSCILTSNVACPSGNPATSNIITMNVPTSPVVTFTRCFDSITATTAQPFRLKGGIPLGGTYSGVGVTNNIFYPAIAGAGTHQITYTYTNAALCSATRPSRSSRSSRPSRPAGRSSPTSEITKPIRQ